MRVGFKTGIVQKRGLAFLTAPVPFYYARVPGKTVVAIIGAPLQFNRVIYERNEDKTEWPLQYPTGKTIANPEESEKHKEATDSFELITEKRI